MTDTDALLQAARAALRDAQPIGDSAPVLAALDSLAAELEQARRTYDALTAAMQGLGREKGTLEAELERVKAERDAHEKARTALNDIAAEHIGKEQALQARLDKALSVLREAGEHAASPGWIRARLAEIEGEAP